MFTLCLTILRSPSSSDSSINWIRSIRVSIFCKATNTIDCIFIAILLYRSGRTNGQTDDDDDDRADRHLYIHNFLCLMPFCMMLMVMVVVVVVSRKIRTRQGREFLTNSTHNCVCVGKRNEKNEEKKKNYSHPLTWL